jgi:hypothetical protein
VGHVHDGEVRLGADREAAEVRPAQDVRPADGGGGEGVAGGGGREAADDDAAGVAGHAQLIEHIVREAVRADAAADAGVRVAAERVERDAAAGEHHRAMSDLGAAIPEPGEVVGLGKVDPRVVVEEDAVPDHRVGPEGAEVVEPADRRPAGAAHDLLELDDALGGVDLDRLAALPRRRQRVLDLLPAHRVDLGRADIAREAPARVPRDFGREVERVP